MARLQQVLRQPRPDPPPHAPDARSRPHKVGREGKPESYYFPPQLNWTGNNFPYTFMGLEPGTTKDDDPPLPGTLERGRQRHPRLHQGLPPQARHRLADPPGVLHAPGSLVTYEPQWGSDVFGMYQSMVEGRRVPWELLVKDVPEDKHHDLDYLVEQLDWDGNVDPEFKAHNYLEPIVHSGGEGQGYVDKWIVYGKVDGKQLFSASELTVFPGGSVTIKDNGAYGLIAVQGRGTIGKLDVDSPELDPLRRDHQGRGLRHRQAAPRRASPSRTPAASRS